MIFWWNYPPKILKIIFNFSTGTTGKREEDKHFCHFIIRKKNICNLKIIKHQNVTLTLFCCNLIFVTGVVWFSNELEQTPHPQPTLRRSTSINIWIKYVMDSGGNVADNSIQASILFVNYGYLSSNIRSILISYHYSHPSARLKQIPII